MVTNIKVNSFRFLTSFNEIGGRIRDEMMVVLVSVKAANYEHINIQRGAYADFFVFAFLLEVSFDSVFVSFVSFGAACRPLFFFGSASFSAGAGAGAATSALGFG